MNIISIKRGETTMKKLIFFLAAFAVMMSACAPSPAAPAPTSAEIQPLQVVATTSIVADVVGQVGGERVTVTTLLPIGTDVHTYEPAPQDLAKVAEARLVFVNGAGLEEFLQVLIENAGSADRVVEVSKGIELKDFGADTHEEEGEEYNDEGEEPSHEGSDPHTWVDPNNVKIWVENIRAALTAADPAGEEIYRANAQAYLAKLDELDAWVRQQVEQIPPQNRKLVTDHLLFGYFAERYGFEQIGAIIPGYSTAAQPTAQEVAAIEDAIREFGVKAVFVGKTINPTLAQRVAEDTGIQLVGLYHGSLSAAGGEAATYLDYIRYNVTQMVNALK
uniref:Zinc ABC transporter substrate-binding protein n=2 Tax=Bellilinea TaxID=475960 RepID=A0A7C4KYQ1_9CHLR